MKNTALILVDFQNDYYDDFKGSRFPLEDFREKTIKARKVLDAFRQKNIPIYHIKHENLSKNSKFFSYESMWTNFDSLLEPKKNEYVITKRYANSFRDTNLKELLNNQKIDNLIIMWAMSHMCIDSTTRAAYDYWFHCTVLEDICATHDIESCWQFIDHKKVHAAFMHALNFSFAEITTSEKILN